MEQEENEYQTYLKYKNAIRLKKLKSTRNCITTTISLHNTHRATLDFLRKKGRSRSEVIRNALDVYFTLILKYLENINLNEKILETLDPEKFVIIEGKIRELLGEA